MGETKQGEWTALVPLSAGEVIEIAVALELAEKENPTRSRFAQEFYARAKAALLESLASSPCEECQGEDFVDCAGCGSVPVSAGNYEWNAEPSGRVFGGGAEDA